jgi:hypothetical protein
LPNLQINILVTFNRAIVSRVAQVFIRSEGVDVALLSTTGSPSGLILLDETIGDIFPDRALAIDGFLKCLVERCPIERSQE